MYAVPGGMEDWAYAGSWDTAAVKPCTPTTNGGYPTAQTVYNGAQLRAFNVLIETWDAKKPVESELGSWDWPTAASALTVEGPGDGHVPRNARLVLAVLDCAAPYVHVTRVFGVRSAGRQLRAPLHGTQRNGSASGEMTSDVERSPILVQAQRSASAAAAAAAHDDLADRLQRAVEVRRLNRRIVQQQPRRWRLLRGLPELNGTEYSPAPRYLTKTSIVDSASRLPEYGVEIGGAAHAEAFRGPLPCVWSTTSGAAASLCAQHLSQYDVVTSLAADDTGTPFSVGWDVGGGLSVDSTSLLVGAWDARVPPALLRTATFPWNVSSDPSAPLDDASNMLAADLINSYGLEQEEAHAFAAVVRAWQLLLAGRVGVANVSSSAILRHSAAVRGVTRWVFGSRGRQPEPLQDDDDAPAAATAGPIDGAPNLGQRPLLTRFQDCFVVNRPLRGRAAVAVDDPSCRQSTHSSGRQMQPLAAEIGAGGAVQALIAVPYAVVDRAWASQHMPDPQTHPQGHLANARFNASWHHENDGFVVDGRLHAVANPIFFAVTTAWGGVDPSWAVGGDVPSSTSSMSPALTSSASSTPPLPSASSFKLSVAVATSAYDTRGESAHNASESSVCVAGADQLRVDDPPIPVLYGLRSSYLVAYAFVLTGTVLAWVLWVVYFRRRRVGSGNFPTQPSPTSSAVRPSVGFRNGRGASGRADSGIAGGTHPLRSRRSSPATLGTAADSTTAAATSTPTAAGGPNHTTNDGDDESVVDDDNEERRGLVRE